METYVYVFVIGGTLALIGQLLLRKWSFIRMMTIFVFIGIALESVGVYHSIQSFAHAGIEATLVHVGASCIQAVKTGDFTNVIFFISFPLFVAWMTAIVCRPRGRIE
ncbi:SpoVA/SpoVAEb family sporulation membrane protein [Anoxybacillus flavithermus]|uniref:SpoVA/SpoVAEb family sporulation membrane protein n=1 Tax=Anoxybacillus flavithermus TaxID=33934 RepID=A0A2G5RQH2_9BACL|nr:MULTISPECIES: SpoVA/SpoVAEb family sporulation membrane protein [Anoxybacillus]KFZ42019.1 stage V sporulation protein AE-like protein [Anoxybacillus sp. KU2-6(11)]PIC05015.1 SpoVA/SpoVAEb family sporulation membrane protein [Anoxybacillus flavithermus]